MNSQTACCNTPIGPSDASLSPGPKSLPEPAPVQRSHSLSSYYIIFCDALSISHLYLLTPLHFFQGFFLVFGIFSRKVHKLGLTILCSQPSAWMLHHYIPLDLVTLGMDYNWEKQSITGLWMCTQQNVSKKVQFTINELPWFL